MRVLFIAEHLDLPESHLLQGIARAGHEVELLIQPEAAYLDRIEDDVAIHPLRLSGRTDLRGIRSIRRHFRRFRPDLFHCLRDNRPLANALWAAIGIRVARVCYRGTEGHLSRWDPAARVSYLSWRLDTVVCVSDAVRRYLRSAGVPEKRLRTIHKGHDPSWYPQRADLTEFGFAADALVVTAVGNWRPQKGARVFLEAARSMPQDGSVRFLLVGNVLDESITRRAGEPGIREIVHLAGYRHDAAAILGASDVAVVPTIDREGLPRTLMEAMAQGTPAVVTRIGGSPEAVVDGESGLVVPPGDAAALAGAIRRLVEERETRERMGAAARARIEGPFSIATTIAKTLALYEELVNR